MDREGRLDWTRLPLGILAWELEWPALDDVRFERVVSGFQEHYVVTRTAPDSFDFERGEGFDRFGRLDAFTYVDSGQVRRIRAAPIALDQGVGGSASVTAFPAGWRSIAFRLNIRVLLIFWAVALIAARFLLAPSSNWIWWLAAFVLVYAGYVSLAMRSLRLKLANWMRRESWN